MLDVVWNDVALYSTKPLRGLLSLLFVQRFHDLVGTGEAVKEKEEEGRENPFRYKPPSKHKPLGSTILYQPRKPSVFHVIPQIISRHVAFVGDTVARPTVGLRFGD